MSDDIPLMEDTTMRSRIKSLIGEPVDVEDTSDALPWVATAPICIVSPELMIVYLWLLAAC